MNSYRLRHTLTSIRILVVAALLVTAAAAPAWAQSCQYSGRAYGAYVNVLGFGPMYFADTGSLPAAGGTLSSFLLNVNALPYLSANNLVTNTNGANCQANSDATVQDLIVLQGHPAQVTATTVRSFSHADCAGVSGGSVILGLTFGGTPIVVTGGPNQTVTIPGVATLIINEQIVAPGDITVNALHLILLGGTQEVIIASSHSDVHCVTPARSSTWGLLKAVYR